MQGNLTLKVEYTKLLYNINRSKIALKGIRIKIGILELYQHTKCGSHVSTSMK